MSNTTYIQVKSSNGITVMPLETRLMGNRRIFIEGEIGELTACQFVKQIMALNDESTEPIHVYVNSGGGEVNSGMLMYDAIQSSEAPVRMYCIGKAYSMAAILFTSGQHGRFILPHSKLMLHEPLIPYGVGGKSSSIQTISDSLLRVKREMEELLSKHTGKTIKEISRITKTDHYFTADEAVAFGLADGVKDLSAMMKGEDPDEQNKRKYNE